MLKTDFFDISDLGGHEKPWFNIDTLMTFEL